LLTAGWCLMDILQALRQLEARSEDRRDAGRFVPFDGQAAAQRGPLEPEGCNDCASPNLERAAQVCDVRVALDWGCEEMEHCAIVPDVDR